MDVTRGHERYEKPDRATAQTPSLCVKPNGEISRRRERILWKLVAFWKVPAPSLGVAKSTGFCDIVGFPN